MTDRERVLAILHGQSPDRVPWIPRLLLWYNAHEAAGTLPERYRGWSLRDIERDLRLGTPARDGAIFKTEVRNVEVRQHDLDDLTAVIEYVTPAGTVSKRVQGSDALRKARIQDLDVEFILKEREDYAAAEYIVENTFFSPCYDEYEAYDREVGDDGYPMVACGDCPFHEWLKALVGYNGAYYHLSDYPNEVEHLLTVMAQKDKEELWPIIADSPAQLILHGMHLSSQMTPPGPFDAYITPYYREMTALLGPLGKVVAMHGDNDTSAILGNIQDAGFGMVECFVTAPMVETTLEEARGAWGNDVIIWGGVPSAVLEDPFTEEDFEACMDDLFASIAPGDALILGVADNVMPGAKLERVRRITEMVEERGDYPIEPTAS